MTAPPFAYFGGKTRIAPTIAAALPPHKHYVEPFAGSLAVLLAKPRSRMETVNDLDGDLMTFWRVLRDRGDELADVCALTPHSRAEHQAAYDLAVADDLERARRVWVVLSQGRGRQLGRSGWRYFTEGSSSMPVTLSAAGRRMRQVAERLAGVSLECRPAADLIAEYGKTRDNLLYVDPPYLGSTRYPRNRYRHEMRDDQAHRNLAAQLNATQAAVVLSGYQSDLYDDLYDGWHRLEVPASTSQGTTGTARTEVLWSNRPLSQPGLFDHSATSARRPA